MTLYIPDDLVIKAYDPYRYIPEGEQFVRFQESLEYLLVKAREMAELATSYRNFRVGCAIRAFKNNVYLASDHWKNFYGSNVKISENSRPICAEQVALGAAKAEGYDRIIAIVVVGLPQAEEGDRQTYPTLHPCKECRLVFKSSPEIFDNTIIFTCTPKGDKYEAQSFKKLLRAHGERR